ncbi:MAG: VWA domain-containing protein, partial [Thermoanaerobaculia bacterium]|nr:VWA domain-containing protein [Thermoanaerobaculia bacterium]
MATRVPAARWWLGAALVAWVAPGSGQEVEVPDVFTEIIDVRVVNVEVVVTDRDGIRVHGLSRDDFRLLVDGEERAIDFFSEILGGELVPASSGGGAAAPGLADEGASTSYLVFVDDYFAIERDRDRVLGAMIDDLDRLHPRDRMAVVSFDGRELELMTSWSGSRDVLRRALQRASERPAFGLQRMADLRSHDRDGRAGFRRRFGGGLDPLERNYATRLADQVERSVNAAVATLRSFAAPPGRKVMLLLSGGWPYSPAEFAANAWGGSFEAALAASLERDIPADHALFGPLADTANLLGYTLYPVDVPGMGGGFGSGSRGASSVFGREGNVHAALDYLAYRTGGQSLINGERGRALETAVDDTRSYYWLGFALERSGDDRRHRVEVEVLRPGLRVRNRGGFVDLSRRSEVTMVVESSLLFGHPAGELPLELRFGRAEKVKRGVVAIPLEVGFTLDEVTLLPLAEDLVGAEVEIRVTVMDEDGNRSETPVSTVRILGDELPEVGEMFW